MLPPSQLTPESAPAVSVQVLVPPQLAVELVPRSCTQVLIAVHDDSQPEPQLNGGSLTISAGCTGWYSRPARAVHFGRRPVRRLAFGDGMRCADSSLPMRRSWLLMLLLPQLAFAQADAGAVPDEVRQLMKEGLERDLPSPSPRGKAEWPQPEPKKQGVGPTLKNEPGARRVEALSERVRNEASSRASAVAEERRTVPDNQPGVGQSRTRAAKAVGPQLKPKPPKP